MPETVELRINGDLQELQPEWEINAAAQNRRAFTFGVLSDDGSYRPAYDDEVLVTSYENESDPGTIEFAGLIDDLDESGAVGGQVPIISRCVAHDLNILMARRYVYETIPAGTLKAALEVLVVYLSAPPYSVILDPAQEDGPDLVELVYDDVKLDEVLNNDLRERTNGWLAEIYYSAGDRILRMFLPEDNPAPFNIVAEDTEAVGDVTVKPSREGYANVIIARAGPIRIGVFDSGQVGLVGQWDSRLDAPDGTTLESLTNLAESVLARSLIVRKAAIVDVWRPGLVVGQTQTIDLPTRNLDNVFLITEIVTTPLGPDTINRRVTYTEGVVYQPGWREEYKIWSGGSVNVSGAGGGTGGGSTAVRFAYPLGGSKLEPVRGTGTSWEFVGQQVQIDTVPRATLSAEVNLRLSVRDAGVGVKARLYDLSAPGACAGESATVTSSTPQFVTFTATLNAGSHLYQLQVQVDTADRDAIAEGIYIV